MKLKFIVSKRRFRGLVFLTLASGFALFQAGCAEIAGTGEQVSIPPIFINCTTATCKAYPSPRQITVMITTSGCASPDYGAITSGSSTSITCNGTSGCSGQITNWESATIPSGVYSLCGRIDHTEFYPSPSGVYSYGALDNVAISATTANQFISTW